MLPKTFGSLGVCSILAPNTLATPELPNKLGGTVKDLGSLGVSPNKFTLFESPEVNNEGLGAAVRALGAPNREDFTIAGPFDPPNRGFDPIGTEDNGRCEAPPVTPNPGDVRDPGGGIPNKPVLGAFLLSGGEDLLPLPKMLILKNVELPNPENPHPSAISLYL